MAVISKRVFRPLPGKEAIAHARINRMSEVLIRVGGHVRVCIVAWGDNARELHLYGHFPNLEAGAKAFAAMVEDHDGVRLRSEPETDPAADWEGPEVWGVVFGEVRPDFPVMLQREYRIDRRNLKAALLMLPEVQAIQPDRPIIGVAPVVSGDMGRLMICYYAKSLVDLGERMDRFGKSNAFQAMTLRATEFGFLTKARAMVNL